MAAVLPPLPAQPAVPVDLSAEMRAEEIKIFNNAIGIHMVKIKYPGVETRLGDAEFDSSYKNSVFVADVKKFEDLGFKAVAADLEGHFIQVMSDMTSAKGRGAQASWDSTLMKATEHLTDACNAKIAALEAVAPQDPVAIAAARTQLADLTKDLAQVLGTTSNDNLLTEMKKVNEEMDRRKDSAYQEGLEMRLNAIKLSRKVDREEFVPVSVDKDKNQQEVDNKSGATLGSDDQGKLKEGHFKKASEGNTKRTTYYDGKGTASPSPNDLSYTFGSKGEFDKAWNKVFDLLGQQSHIVTLNMPEGGRAGDLERMVQLAEGKGLVVKLSSEAKKIATEAFGTDFLKNLDERNALIEAEITKLETSAKNEMAGIQAVAVKGSKDRMEIEAILAPLAAVFPAGTDDKKIEALETASQALQAVSQRIDVSTGPDLDKLAADPYFKDLCAAVKDAAVKVDKLGTDVRAGLAAAITPKQTGQLDAVRTSAIAADGNANHAADTVATRRTEIEQANSAQLQAPRMGGSSS